MLSEASASRVAARGMSSHQILCTTVVYTILVHTLHVYTLGQCGGGSPGFVPQANTCCRVHYVVRIHSRVHYVHSSWDHFPFVFSCEARLSLLDICRVVGREAQGSEEIG